jgi:hypothetical protein
MRIKQLIFTDYIDGAGKALFFKTKNNKNKNKNQFFAIFPRPLKWA